MRHTRLPAAIGWIVLFVAVIGHLPALKGYFAQDDWGFLARGFGDVEWTGFPARPLSSWFYWRLLVPLFGSSSPPYHGLSLLYAGLMAVFGARIGAQMGLRSAGSAVAGLVLAASGAYALAIFWVSATGELLAALFALAALSLWLEGGRWRWAAGLLMLLSFASKEAGWGVPLWLLLFGAGFAAREDSAPRRSRVLLLLLLLCAGFFLWNTSRHIPHGPGTPYAVAGPAHIARNALGLAAWLVSPLRYPPLHSSINLVIGAATLLAWIGLAGRAWRRGSRLPAAALVWSALGLLPVVILQTHLYPYYLTASLAGVGWTLGYLADRLFPERDGASERDRRVAALVVTAAVLTVVAWSTSHRLLLSRDESGMPVDPIVRRSFIAAEAAGLLRALPLAGAGELAVLQATRVQPPEDLPLPEGELVAGTPLLGALDGTRGLRILVPEGVEVRWSGHLDGVRSSAQVVLDAGDPKFRVLGSVDQARMYSALIAVSAGQHQRARHDLWNVVSHAPATIRFVYDEDNLPIALEDLRRESENFVTLLTVEETGKGQAILDLFGQLYRSVFDEELELTPWGSPLRSGRVDG